MSALDMAVSADAAADLEIVRNRAKRSLDVVGSAALLVLLLPLVLLVGALVRSTSPGPVLFRQVRVGAGGVAFTMLKFRSMTADAESRLYRDPELHRRYLENGNKLRLDEDPRITRVGRFIRRTSLDELPQLWNVLRGHMSLVGPRPVLASELARYGDRVDAYYAARPGLTGAWQVAGRSHIGAADRVRHDVAYVDNWSIRSDLLILLRTPLAVLLCRGSL